MRTHSSLERTEFRETSPSWDELNEFCSIQAVQHTIQLLKKEADLYLLIGNTFQCVWFYEKAGAGKHISCTTICMEIRDVSMYFLCRHRTLRKDKELIDKLIVWGETERRRDSGGWALQ